MFAITGITGQVGGVVARTLLARGQHVRAVVRDPRRAEAWAARGAEIAVADIGDPAALARALAGAEGAFLLVPPLFDPSPGFPEAQAIAASLRSALEQARPGRTVYLSTIGAQAVQTNLLTQHTLAESALRSLPLSITFLRPGWFIENCAWDVAPARESGVIPSFLQPLDKPVPMVATDDIGRLAAELLLEPQTGSRVVELEGPQRITPNQIASTFTDLLGRPVRMEVVPHDSWESIFRSQGMKNPLPRIQMLDGFNEGWIEFEAGPSGSRKGTISLRTALQSLVERASG
jgi:uncharacterized protein YbjT (DUF2867 family)